MKMALKRLHDENTNLFSTARIDFEDRLAKTEGVLVVNDKADSYLTKPRKSRKKRSESASLK